MLRLAVLGLLLAVVVGTVHADEKVSRTLLIEAVDAYQSKARNKATYVECIARTQFEDGGQVVAFKSPSRFLFDDRRLFVSQYIGGISDRGLVLTKREFGYDGRKSIDVKFDGEKVVSATSDCKKPSSVAVLDPNLSAGVCIAYGAYLPAKQYLKTPGGETFLVAFLKQCDAVERQRDDQLEEEIIATLKSGRTTHYLTFKSSPMVHCVRYRSKFQRENRTSTETIAIRYKNVDGDWLVASTSRTIVDRVTSTNGEMSTRLLVACDTEISKLEFIENARDDQFLPTIPLGIEVEDFCGKPRVRSAPKRGKLTSFALSDLSIFKSEVQTSK